MATHGVPASGRLIIEVGRSLKFFIKKHNILQKHNLFKKKQARDRSSISGPQSAVIFYRGLHYPSSYSKDEAKLRVSLKHLMVAYGRYYFYLLAVNISLRKIKTSKVKFRTSKVTSQDQSKLFAGK